MSSLFDNDKNVSKEAVASQEFATAYRKMTDEVNRVANEPVTIWARLTTWIYEKIFGDSSIRKNPTSEKQKQMTHRQMYDAADAFDDMANHFNPVETDSLDNEQILNHAKKAKL
jgi:hypothetical protein